MPKVEQFIVDAVDSANDKYHEAHLDILGIWKSVMFLSWHWWVGAALSVLPWVLWLIIRKKESTGPLLLGGFAVLIISSFLDAVGTAMRLWDYSTKVIPLIPPYLPWDFTLMPVTAMLFYQFKPKWSPYLKAAVFSGIGSFLVQPLFKWMHFYVELGWKDYYSFPIMVGIYLLGHVLVTRIRFEKL